MVQENGQYPNPFAHFYEELEIIKKQIKEISGSQAASQKSEIMSAKALGERLNISPRTIARLRNQNRIPFIQEGRVIRYNLPRVVEALEKQRCGR